MTYLVICLISLISMIINNVRYEKYKKEKNYKNKEGVSEIISCLKENPFLTLSLIILGTSVPIIHLSPIMAMGGGDKYFADRLEKAIKEGNVYYDNNETIDVENYSDAKEEVLIGEVVENEKINSSEIEELFSEYMFLLLSLSLNLDLSGDIKTDFADMMSEDDSVIDVSYQEIKDDEKKGPQL